MKKAILIVLTTLLFFLAGCAQKQEEKWTSETIAEESVPNESLEEILFGETSSEVKGPSESTDQMMITITAGEHMLTATLYDNAAGRTFWDKLPLTLPMMNLYGREMCYRFGKGGLPEDEAADTGYEIGDISYWPPAGSLVILYRQNGEVFEQQPIGHTDDDLSFFEGMDDLEITFDKAS